MRPLILALALAATPSLAQTPLTADEFEAHVTGRTITYQQYDFVFGVEEYLEGRQVRWSVAPNLCQYGTWYPEGDAICFVYDDAPTTAHCWTFWLEEGALVALATDSFTGAELFEVDRSDTPLSCPGPDVGV